ncbi:DUF3768 domain-containing protein [Fluviibacterium sp. S390]|uniref:DUF3768 domain-containing protein n=1 Tax=Fluviibacterium sp. S390 TaxID=3415139 RepID=UPI003C7E6208
MNTQVEEEDLGATPRCKSCGSERVVRAAWACWNPESGLWELETVLEQPRCLRCNDKAELVWKGAGFLRHKRIRELNDRFRMEGAGTGSVLLTSGVQELGGLFAVTAIKAVRSFTGFTEDNDPWGEHDFGAVEIDGQKIFFKIDYYDPDLQSGSENPANEALTHRVLTIMLAHEY